MDCRGNIGRALGVLALAASAALPSSAQHLSGSNGVYGGYVASDAWFASMRRSPHGSGSTNAAWRASIERGIKSGRLSEVGLFVSFPKGNPFPGRHVPDLKILDPHGKDIGAYPYAAKTMLSGALYYLVLQKGERYTLRWFYIGGSETFGHVTVGKKSPRRMRVTVPYQAPGSASQGKGPNAGEYGKRPHPRNASHPVHSDHAYVPPKSDGDFQAPQSDGSYQAPK